MIQDTDMKIKEISREYSRTVTYRKPDGTDIWLKHGAGMVIELSENEMTKADEASREVSDVLVAQVGDAIKAERAKLDAAFKGKNDEPFGGKPDALSDMPVL